MQFLGISKHWRLPKVVLYLFAFEFLPIIAILALVSIANPDTYRDQLWQEGYDLGLNSNPTDVVYSYANYKPVKIPLVWSSSITSFNLVISVLAMFILLTKVTVMLMHCFYPIFSFLAHGLLIGLFSYSIHGQSGEDNLDPTREAKIPWYISQSCSIASTQSLEGYCQQAKSTFAVSIILLALYVVHLCLSIWSMVPTAEQKEKRQLKQFKKDEEKRLGAPSGKDAEHHGWTDAEWRRETWRAQQAQQQWEMQNYPVSPGTAASGVGFAPAPTFHGQEEVPPMPSLPPITPRTKAFHALGGGRDHTGGDLPLRARYQQEDAQPGA